MRDVLAKMRECGKDVKMRDFPHDCGMVDTYASSKNRPRRKTRYCSMFLIADQAEKSEANRLAGVKGQPHLWSTNLGVRTCLSPLIYTNNKVGPIYDLCGTPLITNFQLETSPSTTAHCLLSVSHCSIQLIVMFPTPRDFILLRWTS